jgi:hypothetical protein
VYEQNGDLFSIYYDCESYKQFILFLIMHYMFIISCISSATRDFFFSAGQGGVWGAQTDGKSQAIA